MSFSDKYPGLGDPPPTQDASMAQWMQTITDILRQGTGQLGYNNWLTWDHLEDSEVVEPVSDTGGATLPPGSGSPGDEYVVKPAPIDNTPPPVPKNVKTSGSPTAIRIIWDNPVLDYSYRANVHVGDVDDVGQSTLAGSSNGTIYEHIMGSNIALQYFWVRFSRGTGEETVTGPWNQTAGTPGQIEGELVDAQLGNLDVDKLVGGTADFVEANILEGTITNAKIGSTIQSDNYQPGVQGWIIKK